ncbi:YceI family protein [Haliscomenobacter sp.]|uniref:YceI family protein n=1 Tax=Haliscomenobacter sp. TaxID=2717303 RepID=UPI003364CC38
MIKCCVLTCTALLLISTPPLFAQKALVLQSAKVEYKIKNAGINTTGHFGKVAADIIFDANNLEKSKISATVQVGSLNSGIGLRDKHLKGEAYFNAEKYPAISLISTKITKTDSGYLGTFNLNIKAVTQFIQLPFTVTQNGNILDFQTNEFSIDRLTYGVGKSSITLSNTVNISIKATFSM